MATLRTYRERTGRTRGEVAEIAGYAQRASVTKLEQGRIRGLPIARAQRLAVAYGLTLDEFLVVLEATQKSAPE